MNIVMNVVRLAQPEINISLESIDEIVKEYLLNVLSITGITLEELEDMDEDKVDAFRFDAADNWESGNDFVLYCIVNGHDINTILDIQKLTKMYLLVNRFYSENYGNDDTMRWDTFSPENVLRNYVYFYVYGLLSHQELVDTLRSKV